MDSWQEIKDWDDQPSQKPDYNQRQRRPNPSNSGGEQANKRLSIPTNKIGRIIGKGGNMIQNIQKETHTKIDIVRGQSETSEASISGSPHDIQKAEDMIMRLTTEEFNRKPREDFGGDRKPRDDWGGDRKPRDGWGGDRKPRDDWGGDRKPRDDWGGDRSKTNLNMNV